MRIGSRPVMVAAVLFAATVVGCAPASTVKSTPTPHRFYTGKPYGSEAGFSPLTELLNEGFDVLSVHGQDRRIFQRGLGADARNVFSSVIHVDQTYARYGLRRALHDELIPTPATTGGVLANYQLHFFGSGMVSRRLSEWYDLHGFAHPDLLGATSLMAAHFLNEMVENAGMKGPNEEATADLFLFDGAGIALWKLDWTQRTFSGALRVTNWPGQPSYNPATGTLENSGQFFVLRGPLPRTDHLRFFYYFGMYSLAGLSLDVGHGEALSIGGALDGSPPRDSLTPGVGLKPKVGVFYDRGESLLWSVVANQAPGALSSLTLNIYPRAFHADPRIPGLWIQKARTGGVRFGLVSSLGVGIGAGSAK